MERYKILNTVGDGAYGNVYKAVNKSTGEVVAIKKMKKKYYSWDECMSLREIKSLRKLSHPNLVKLKEVIRASDELFFVFEFLDCNVYQLMKDRQKPFSELKIKNIMYQTLQGLAYMHKQGYFHRDMKPENLLAHGDKIKIGDLGLAREIRSRPPYTDYVSTRWYRAPEILLKSPYNSPIDIFAVGTIMAELYSMRPLFPGSNEHDQMMKICAVFGAPTSEEWPDAQRLASKIGFVFPKFEKIPLSNVVKAAPPEAIDLMIKMMRYDPIKRFTATECLEHPYFDDVRNNKLEKPNFIDTKSNLFTFKGNPYESKYANANKASREKSRERKLPVQLMPAEPQADGDIDQLLSSVEKNMFSQPKQNSSNNVPTNAYGMLPSIKPQISNTYTYGAKPVLSMPFSKFTKENYGFDGNFKMSNIVTKQIPKYVSDYQDKDVPSLHIKLNPIALDFNKKVAQSNLEKDDRHKKFLEPLLFGKQFNLGQPNNYEFGLKYKSKI